MSNSLLENMKVEQSKTFTENGATAFNSTREDLVNLFASVGAMRSRLEDIPQMFSKALANDELLATKIAFYARDIRGGLGERDAGRIMFKELAELRPNIMKENLKELSEFGRWDDLFAVYNTSLKEDVVAIIKDQLQEDKQAMQQGDPVSLLAKWLPSINASSFKTKELAKDLSQELGLTYKEYRQELSALRDYLNVTEVRLSQKDYNAINYEQVPSKAMNMYRLAFLKNDPEAFNMYKLSLEKGEAKINASTLYPYDIVEKILYRRDDDKILEEQWKALPNYVQGENNFLIMADVSGSMQGRPMATSIGLAIYFAERNQGDFANKFMTFSGKPELVEVKGSTLKEKVYNARGAHWDMNTDLEKAFNLVLETAEKYNTPKQDMPTSIVVISDMEIDQCTDIREWGFYDTMKERFKEKGYEIPNIVFWNVNSRQNTFHAEAHAQGVQLASGQSPSVFKALVDGNYLTPYQYMVNTVCNERYDNIKLPEAKMNERLDKFMKNIENEAKEKGIKVMDYVENKLKEDPIKFKEYGIKDSKEFENKYYDKEYQVK